MRSSSQHLFAQVPSANIPRSSFSRNMAWKTAFDAGLLVPVYIDEVLPGDTFNLKMTIFGRLATPVVPFMDNLYLDVHFFFVPNRLLWDNWQRMMGEQANPGDSIDFLVPEIDYTNRTPGYESIDDYFGIPLGKSDIHVIALWHRAYNLIWNEWYRDENLQSSVVVHTDDGPDDAADYTLLRRGKRHDYFTSCLPFVQKGDAAGVLLSGTVPVYGDGNSLVLTDGGSVGGLLQVGNPTQRPIGAYSVSDLSTPLPVGSSVSASTGAFSLGLSLGVPTISQTGGGSVGLLADLEQSVGITVNALRESFAVQRLLEKFARGGSRYIEILRSCFGVTSPDARLQRPEYLGGGTTPINVHSVAQTSSTDTTTPQGNMAAFGVVAGSGIGFVKSFVEHGVIIGLASVRADLTYQSGLHKMFSRRSRLDYYWPALHNLGEQAVLNKEIYSQGDSVVDSSGDIVDNQAFGYQERWAEYRYGMSRITGKLRSSFAQSLDYWHLAQNFTQLPSLNADFIEEHPPVDRVLAVTDEPEIIYDSLISLNCVRPMGTYSVPGYVDHL